MNFPEWVNGRDSGVKWPRPSVFEPQLWLKVLGGFCCEKQCLKDSTPLVLGVISKRAAWEWFGQFWVTNKSRLGWTESHPNCKGRTGTEMLRSVALNDVFIFLNVRRLQNIEVLMELVETLLICVCNLYWEMQWISQTLFYETVVEFLPRRWICRLFVPLSSFLVTTFIKNIFCSKLRATALQ